MVGDYERRLLVESVARRLPGVARWSGRVLVVDLLLERTLQPEHYRALQQADYQADVDGRRITLSPIKRVPWRRDGCLWLLVLLLSCVLARIDYRCLSHYYYTYM